MRRPGSRRLEDAIAALARALGGTGAPWMLVGGIAVIAHGVRRFTTDVDAVVRGDAISVARLLRALSREHIAPRIPDAARFAEESLVLLLRHADTGVDLDVSLAWSAFERDSLDAATEVSFGRARARAATAADLLVMKAVAGRPIDLQDAEALVVLHPTIDLARARACVVELAALAEVPELVTGFDDAVRRARAVVSPPPPKRRARRRP